MNAIQALSDALPIIVQSGLAVKLLDSVNGIASALYGPRLVFRNGKAEIDVEAYRREKLGDVYLELTKSEVFFLHNFFSAFACAADELNGEGDEKEEGQSEEEASPEFDWMMRFFDATSRVTDKDLQLMWGKILAGETRKVGSFSLRTLEIVRNLSHDEAKMFDRICRHVMWSGNTLFLFDNGFHELEYLDDGTPYNEASRSLVEEAGLNDQDNTQPLVEAGLLTQDHRFAGTFKSEDLLAMGNKSLLCFVKADADHTTIVFDPYLLTKSGSELFRAIANGNGFEPDHRYDSACIKELSKLYPNHQWTAFVQVDADRFEQLDL